jgi:hypothetical protein
MFIDSVNDLKGMNECVIFYAAILSGDKGEQGKLIKSTSQNGDRKAVKEMTEGTPWTADLDLRLIKLEPQEGVSQLEMEMNILNKFDAYNEQAEYAYTPSDGEYNSNSLAITLPQGSGASNIPTEFFGFDPGSKIMPDKYFPNVCPLPKE